MPGNVLHDLNCILEHWCFPINASLQHVRTCTPTHRSSTFTIQYITIFQSNSSPRFPKTSSFFFWCFLEHWVPDTGMPLASVWKTTWKKPWYRRGGFPFFFRWRLGPMNLVPSVKPGARELNASEMTWLFFFVPKVGNNPPKSHHLSGFLGFTRNSWRDWGSGARWRKKALSGTYVLEQRDSKYFVRNLELLQFWRACILVNMDLECSKRCLHERCQWNWIIAVSNW